MIFESSIEPAALPERFHSFLECELDMPEQFRVELFNIKARFAFEQRDEGRGEFFLERRIHVHGHEIETDVILLQDQAGHVGVNGLPTVGAGDHDGMGGGEMEVALGANFSVRRLEGRSVAEEEPAERIEDGVERMGFSGFWCGHGEMLAEGGCWRQGSREARKQEGKDRKFENQNSEQ